MSATHGLRLATKIWLSIGILVVGYGVSEFYAYRGSRQLEGQIEYISKHLVPAARSGQLALIAVRQQVRSYAEAGLFEQPELVDAAKEAGARARQELLYIGNMLPLPEELRRQAAGLAGLLDDYTAQANVLTPVLIEVAVQAKTPPYEDIERVAKLERELLRRLQLFRSELERLLRADHAALIDASWTRRMTGLVAFVVTIGLTILLVNIALRVWVTGPIAHTVKEIGEMGQGIVPEETGARGDEMVSLRASFGAMRDAIGRHIDSLEREIQVRTRAEAELQHHRDHLEDMVRQRTEELSRTIDELKRAQQQLVEAEKMQALGTLVAGIAHEINTPVGVGITAVSFLRDQLEQLRRHRAGGDTDPEALDRVLGTAEQAGAMIQANLDRAAQLVKSFKQVAVDQSSERARTFDLAEYLGEIVTTLTPRFKQDGHVVTVDCPPGITMTSFPGALSQVLTNLVMNSCVHGFGEGRRGTVRIIATASDGRLKLVHRDDGAGMEPEVVQRLYEPFFTTKRGQGGSGLGMQLVYNLVTRTLKGSIHCESSPGTGTTFVLEMPLVLDKAASDDRTSRLDRTSSGRQSAVDSDPA